MSYGSSESNANDLSTINLQSKLFSSTKRIFQYEDSSEGAKDEANRETSMLRSPQQMVPHLQLDFLSSICLKIVLHDKIA